MSFNDFQDKKLKKTKNTRHKSSRILWIIKSRYQIIFSSFEHPCHWPVGPPALLEKLVKNRPRWKKNPKFSIPLGDCHTILYPYLILNGKNCTLKSPLAYFWAGNNRFSNPIEISIEVFTPTEEKSSAMALKEGCFWI